MCNKRYYKDEDLSFACCLFEMSNNFGPSPKGSKCLSKFLAVQKIYSKKEKIKTVSIIEKM